MPISWISIRLLNCFVLKTSKYLPTKTIESLILKYLWDPRKYAPLKKEVIKNELSRGGLNFPDVTILSKAYLIMRIPELLKNPLKVWSGTFIYHVGRSCKR